MRWKKIVIAAGCIVVLLIVAFYGFIAFYDFNRFKPRISDAVKAATGRDLTIAGDIGFKLGIRPTLYAAGVSFQNAPWSSRPMLARVKLLEGRVAILPLITGNLEISRIVLIEPDVIVEFSGSGVSNFAFETAEKKEVADPPKEQTETKPPPLIFSDVHIENGRFTYKDAASDFNFTVSIDRLDGTIPGFDKSMQLDFEGAYDDIPLNIKGSFGPIWAWVAPGYSLPADLTIEAGGATAIVKGELRNPTDLSNLAFDITAEGPSLKNLAETTGIKEIPDLGAFKFKVRFADPDGKLEVEGLDIHIGSEDPAEIMITGDIDNLLALEGINLNFAAQGKDVANLAKLGMPPSPARGAFSVAARIADVESNVYAAEDLQVILGENEATGRIQLDLAQQVPLLTAKLSSQKFHLGPFNLDVKLSGPMDKPAIKNLDLKLGTPELAEIHLKGTVADLKVLNGVDLDFKARGNNLANLEQLTQKPLPLRGAFSATGKVLIPVPKNLKIPKLKVSLGKTNIDGSLGLDLRGEEPRLSAKLSSPKLDLTNTLSPELAKLAWVKGLAQMHPVKLDATLAGYAENLGFEKLDLQAGTYKSSELRLSGSVENVSAMRGVELDLSIKGQDLDTFKKMIGQAYLFAPIPASGAYAISGKINVREANIFRISDFEFSVEKSSIKGWLDLNLAGPKPQIEVQMFNPNFNPRVLPLPDAGMLANLKEISDLGPLQFTSKMSIDGDQVALQHMDLEAGSDQLVAVKARGSIRNLTVLSGMDLDVVIRGNEIANLEKITGQSLPLKGAYATSGKITDPRANHFKISDLSLKLGENNITGWFELDFSSKQTTLSTDLTARQFTLHPLTLPALESLGRIKDLGPLKLVATLVGAGNNYTLKNLDLSVGSDQLVTVALKGTIKDLSALSGMDLEFMLRGDELANFKKLGGPELPFKGAFNFAGQFMDPEPEIYRLPSINAHLGDNVINGWMELNMSKERPRVKAELSSEHLDLRPLLAEDDKTEAPETKTPSTGKQNDKVFSSEPFQLEGLKAIDAELKFRDKKVLFPNIAINDVHLDVLLDNGNLRVKPFKFIIGGGSANVQFELRQQDLPPTFELVHVAEQLDLGAMLEELGYKRTLEGKLDTDIHLTGRGGSVAELMAGLQGDIYANTGEGRMESRYLDLLQRYLGSNILQLLNPFQSQERFSRVNCFVNHIDINDGLAELRLLLDTEQTSILVAGDIDLKTELLDLGVKPTPKEGFSERGGSGISFSLRQLSQPFRLGGTLASPSLALDPTRTAFTLGKFAGALALGPAGIAAFFADVSVGREEPCALALQGLQKEKQAEEDAEMDSDSEKTEAENTDEQKSEGFFRRMFRRNQQ